MRLHLHHGYIGGALVGWSALAAGFRLFLVGEYNPWLACAGFLVGGALLIHDLYWHLNRGRVRGCKP